MANGGPALTAAQQAAGVVPIVFTAVSEPVEPSFVASLAAPGGSTTGFTNLETTMGGKWLELLKDIAPQVTRVVAMFNPASSFAVRFFSSAQEAAPKLAVEVFASHVRDAAETEAALTTLGRETGVALMLPPDGFTPAHRKPILDLAALQISDNVGRAILVRLLREYHIPFLCSAAPLAPSRRPFVIARA